MISFAEPTHSGFAAYAVVYAVSCGSQQLDSSSGDAGSERSFNLRTVLRHSNSEFLNGFSRPLSFDDFC